MRPQNNTYLYQNNTYRLPAQFNLPVRVNDFGLPKKTCITKLDRTLTREDFHIRSTVSYYYRYRYTQEK